MWGLKFIRINNRDPWNHHGKECRSTHFISAPAFLIKTIQLIIQTSVLKYVATIGFNGETEQMICCIYSAYLVN